MEQRGIFLRNINLTGISRSEQMLKVIEEEEEFTEAYDNYLDNKTEDNKNHVIDELLDEFQSKLGLLEKEGIKAEEVQAYYSTWIKKLANRPRIKECRKCVNCSLTTFGAVKAYQCDKNDEMIYSDDYAKECRCYEEGEEQNE